MDNNIFNQEFYNNVDRNWYDSPFVHKTTMRFGKLYPLFVKEVLPGDYWQISCIKQLKALTLKTPVFHRQRIFEHWYFVPNRLVWKNWELFITDTESGIPPPTISWPDASEQLVGVYAWQTIGQYMGLPIDLQNNQWLVNAMPLAGYALIWNEYYREQSVMGEITINLQDGINVTPTNISIHYMYACLMKCWRKDYYTSVLPSAQKGSPVKMPINNAPTVTVTRTGNTIPYWQNTGGTPLSGTVTGLAGNGNLQVGGANAQFNPNDSLVVNLDANAVTMNTFRFAMALQSFLEKDNIGGGRYTEVIRAHFNEMPPDFRLQRPEYLGGNVQTMMVDEILSTAETKNDDGQVPIGQYGGNMNSMYAGDQITYKSTEHGFIFCLVSVEPDLDYITKGLNKMWTRELREDYAWPTFAHLGEQPVYNWEINADHNSPESIFGYQPPYTDYKFNQNMISGEFSQSLAFWHLGIEAPQDVAFNSQFLLIDDLRWDLTRIFAINPQKPDNYCEDYLLCQAFFDVKIQRALPRFSIPKLIG